MDSTRTSTPRAIVAWFRRLDDPSEERRSSARLKLEAAGRAAAIPFFEGYDGFTVAQRLEGLDLLGGAGRSAALARRAADRLVRESDARLRASLVMLLGRTGSHRDIPALARALRDPDRRVRANAVEALSEVGGREVIKLLVPLLRDGNNRVRANTARALWKFDDMRDLVREAFEEMLADSSKWMRASAFYTFGEIGVMEFFQSLLDSIDEEDEDIARNAVVALVGYAEKFDPAAAPPREAAKVPRKVSPDARTGRGRESRR